MRGLLGRTLMFRFVNRRYVLTPKEFFSSEVQATEVSLERAIPGRALQPGIFRISKLIISVFGTAVLVLNFSSYHAREIQFVVVGLAGALVGFLLFLLSELKRPTSKP